MSAKMTGRLNPDKFLGWCLAIAAPVTGALWALDGAWSFALAQLYVVPAVLYSLFLSRRLIARDGRHVLRADARLPILYLRSFGADESDVSSRFGLFTDEDRLVSGLSHVGPVIGVGVPGQWLRSTGAARFHVPHERWQPVVEWLLPRVAFVAIRVGVSGGLRWEVERARELVAPSNRLLMAPCRERRLLERLLNMEFSGRCVNTGGRDDWLIVRADQGAPVFCGKLSRWKKVSAEFLAESEAPLLATRPHEISEYLHAQAVPAPSGYTSGLTWLLAVVAISILAAGQAVRDAWVPLLRLLSLGLTGAIVVPVLALTWTPRLAERLRVAVVVPACLLMACVALVLQAPSRETRDLRVSLDLAKDLVPEFQTMDARLRNVLNRQHGVAVDDCRQLGIEVSAAESRIRAIPTAEVRTELERSVTSIYAALRACEALAKN